MVLVAVSIRVYLCASVGVSVGAVDTETVVVLVVERAGGGKYRSLEVEWRNGQGDRLLSPLPSCPFPWQVTLSQSAVLHHFLV